MRTRLVRRPEQHGTRDLVAQYGEQLICVRYRYDPIRKKRYKTVELIVALGREVGVEVSPAEFDREAWATPRKLVEDVQRRLAAA